MKESNLLKLTISKGSWNLKPTL